MNFVLGSCALGAPCAAQIQTAKLMAFDGYQWQNFGTSVAAQDGWLVVGVRQDSEIAEAAGAAYSYQRRAGGWTFLQKFAGHDTSEGNNFGWATALQGSMCVVTTISNHANNVFSSGAAYVFERTGTQWVQVQKLSATPAIANASFGWSVAIDGDRMLIGARSENSIGSSAGAVYVFERVAGVWSQTARLLANDGTHFDFFGQSVALHGDTALIGSAAAGSAGLSQGAAYVFEFNGVQWTQVDKLRASDPNASSSFASRLVLASNVAVIGSTTHRHSGLTGTGGAYAFRRLGGAWQEVQELLQHAWSNSLLFGSTGAILGDLALIGSARDPHNLTGRGAAYLFRHEPSGWNEIARLTANDISDGNHFGSVLALDGSTVVVGVPARDDLCPTIPTCDSGAVYIFEFCPDARQFGWCLSGAPCANHDKNAGCVNATGVGATLGAAGSSSVALDELRLEARKLQPHKSSLLFMGASVGQAVLGDGLRVVAAGAAGLYRFGLLQADAEGAALYPHVISRSQVFPPTGHIQPGSVWNFQGWYRDPAGPCNTGTNLTNAIEITFRP